MLKILCAVIVLGFMEAKCNMAEPRCVSCHKVMTEEEKQRLGHECAGCARVYGDADDGELI